MAYIRKALGIDQIIVDGTEKEGINLLYRQCVEPPLTGYRL